MNNIKKISIWILILFIGKDVVIPRLFFMLSLDDGIYSYIAAFVQYVWMIVITYLFNHIWKLNNNFISKNDSGGIILNVFRIIIITIALFVFMQFFRGAINLIYYNKMGELLVKSDSYIIGKKALIALFLIHGIWASIAEEYVYRYIMLSEMRKVNQVVCSILTVSICFSSAHNSIEQMMQAFILSIVLCILYIKYNNIFFCLSIHIGYNVLGIIQSYVYNPIWGNIYSSFQSNTKFENLILALESILIGSIASYILVMCLIKNLNWNCKVKNKQILSSIFICILFLLIQGLKKY